MSILVLLQEAKRLDSFRPGTDLYRLLLSAEQDYNSLLNARRDLQRQIKSGGRDTDALRVQIGKLSDKLDKSEKNCTETTASKNQRIDSLKLMSDRRTQALKDIRTMHKNVAGACPICGVNKCDTWTLADTILSTDPDNPGGGQQALGTGPKL